MANINSFNDFFVDVANAIRNKTGKTEQILAKDFDTEINSIIALNSNNIAINEYVVAAGQNITQGDFISLSNTTEVTAFSGIINGVAAESATGGQIIHICQPRM